MLAFFKRHRELLLVSTLLVYPFVNFLVVGARPRATPAPLLDRLLLGTLAPGQKLLVGTIEGSAGLWHRYVGLRAVERENTQLKAQAQRLQMDAASLAEARAENERLRRMLGFSDAHPGIKYPAHVLGVSPDALHQWVRVDRGEQEGIQVGMAVATPDGLAGQVMRTTAHYADVMLLTDPSSRVGVRVEPTRSRATAVGTGGAVLRLENAVKSDPLQDGDVLVTSGNDGVYPPGLMVGKVTGLRHNGGMFWSANLIPAVDTTKLEELFILPSTLPSGAADLSSLADPSPTSPGAR